MSTDADVLAALSGELSGAADRLRSAVAAVDVSTGIGVADQWWGTAADAAAARLAATCAQFGDLADDLDRVAQVLGDAVPEAVEVACASALGPLACLAWFARWTGLDAVLAARLRNIELTDVSEACMLTRWATASDIGRAELVADHPEVFGNLDGVPAAVRDQANRARLESERARLLAEADRLRHELDSNIFGGFLSNADAGLDQTSARLADLDAIEDVLARGDRQLLLFDNSAGKQTHAAVVSGNLDTADRVAVMVPGLDSSVGGDLPGLDAEFAAVAADAATRSGDDVAGVVWMGYDTPRWGWDLLDPDRSVINDGAARAGGADLAHFLDSLQSDSTTLVGHSYGSLTAATALELGAGVDDLVAMGSPGLGSPGAQPWGSPWGGPDLNGARLSVLETVTDPVADLGWFGSDPSLAPLTGEQTRWLSTEGSHGHSDYLTPGSTSAANVAAVIAGQDPVPVQDRIDASDVLRVALALVL